VAALVRSPAGRQGRPSKVLGIDQARVLIGRNVAVLVKAPLPDSQAGLPRA